jgi:hypothetical protein
MSKDISSIEVTPKIIDLGASVVPLANVTRAGIVVQHPLQSAGTWLLVLAGILLLFEASPFGSELRFPPRPSTLLWIVCGLGGLGVFMLAYARRRLVIATADGQRITLPPTDAQFAAAVTSCIREAVEHGAAGAPHYRIDLGAKTIATLAGPPAVAAGTTSAYEAPAALPANGGMAHGMPHGSAVSAGLGRSGPPAGIALPPGLGQGTPILAPNGAHAAPSLSAPREHTGPPTGPGAGPGANGVYRNGGGEPQGAFERDLVRRLDGLTAQSQAAAAPQLGHTGAYGAPPFGAGNPGMPGAVRPGQIAMPVDDGGLGDLALLIQVVERANVQHKDALIDLLRVVEDHKRGGATSREDARAHWQSFAEYVQQYLGNIDGLADATQRFGQVM